VRLDVESLGDRIGFCILLGGHGEDSASRVSEDYNRRGVKPTLAGKVRARANYIEMRLE
jgi:hypothetical protein